jgi:hypothetical protein
MKTAKSYHDFWHGNQVDPHATAQVGAMIVSKTHQMNSAFPGKLSNRL